MGRSGISEQVLRYIPEEDLQADYSENTRKTKQTTRLQMLLLMMNSNFGYDPFLL